MKRLISIASFTLLLVFPRISGNLSAQELVAASSLSTSQEFNVYRYRMKGKVRLLIFWVGKDDVGGGWISVSKKQGADPGTWAENVEVLFGSKPERVPGKINRWGYGRESATWETSSQDRARHLTQTILEGFMRHSAEESLPEVRAKDNAEKADRLFWYDATRSTVAPGLALAETRIFSEAEDFDYRRPEAIQQGYQKRLRSGPPDKRKRLINRKGAYAAPYGFLTGVHEILRRISEQFMKDQSNWKKLRPSLHYVYNAKLFRLRVRGLKYLKMVRIPGGKSSSNEEGETRIFNDLAKAEFRLRNVKTRYKHDFSILFPLHGPLQAIPIRIVDKPRWWLRIELNLEPDIAPKITQRSATLSTYAN